MIRARPDVELIFVKRDLMDRRQGAMAKTPRPRDERVSADSARFNSGLEQALHAPVIAPGHFALHQQGQELIELQRPAVLVTCSSMARTMWSRHGQARCQGALAP